MCIHIVMYDAHTHVSQKIVSLFLPALAKAERADPSYTANNGATELGGPSATTNKRPQKAGAQAPAQRRKRTTGDTELKALLGHWRHTCPQAPQKALTGQLSQPAGPIHADSYPNQPGTLRRSDVWQRTSERTAGKQTPQQSRHYNQAATERGVRHRKPQAQKAGTATPCSTTNTRKHECMNT